MRVLRRSLAGLFLLAAATALTSCAPYVVPAGSEVAPPRLIEESVIAADGTQLPLQKWLPASLPRAVILALHGFNDYAHGFDLPAERLVEASIAVYAYDQRGFGRTETRGLWPGTAALVDDAVAAARLLRARHPNVPLFFLGESMGGAVAMLALTRTDAAPVDGAILEAPAVWGRRHLSWFRKGLLDFFAHTIPWYPLTGQGLRIRASDNEAALRALRDDKWVIKQTRVDAIYGLVDLMDDAFAVGSKLRTPTLLLYGRRDDLIPVEPTADMLTSVAPGAPVRVAVYDQGFHYLLRDLGADKVLDDIVAWTRNTRGSLPSGAEVPRAGWARIKAP